MPDEQEGVQNQEDSNVEIPLDGADDEQLPEELEDSDVSDDDEKEPGGDHPGFVRGRKEYRLRKKTEVQLQTEREARIRAEERNKFLETVPQATPQPERRLTREEIKTAVESQEMDVLDATEYLSESKRLEQEKSESVIRNEQAKIKVQFDDARKEIDGYIGLAPSLGGKHDHPRFTEVQAAFNQLVAEGYGSDIRTERLALREVFGKLDSFKKRVEANKQRRSDHHVESATGGNHIGMNTNRGKNEFGDIPKHHQDYWNKRGFTLEERKKEAETIRKRQPYK
jgi:hypothetical protein